MKILNKNYSKLRIQNEKLKTSIQIITEDVTKYLWADTPRLLDYYTNHEQAHSLNIIEVIFRILTMRKKKLSDEERYILIISAFLHDIGLQCDLKKMKDVSEEYSNKYERLNIDTKSMQPYTKDEQNIIREKHNLLSAVWIEVAYHNRENPLYRALSTIPTDLLDDIISVCKYHCKLKIDELPQSKNSDIDLSLLILLFRISDELDMGDHRCNIRALDTFGIPAHNAMHWIINSITKCKISEINDISLSLSVNEDDYNTHFEALKQIINKFDKKNKLLIEKLRYIGLPISFSHNASSININKGIQKLNDDIVDAIYYYIYNKPYTTNEIKYQEKSVKKGLTCYISFSRKSISENDIKEIENDLYINSNRTMEVLYFNKLTDHSHQTLLDTINNVNCIIIIANEEYVSEIKIEDSSCYNEYNIIYNRYNNLYTQNASSCIIKIMSNCRSFLNNKTLFEELNIRYIPIDISDYKTSRRVKGNNVIYEMNKNIRLRHRHIFEKIFAETLSNVYTQSSKYKNVLQLMYRNFFLNTKEEAFLLPNTCFVKTNSYLNISNGSSYIVIGRKGSGKSTVVNTISEIDEDLYKGIVHIKVDDIQLEHFFDEYNIATETITTKMCFLQ